MSETATLTGASVLTHSRMVCAKTCLRKHQWCYELGIRPDYDALALRMGSAVHLGVALLAGGQTIEQALETVCEQYDAAAPPFDLERENAWLVERETICRLLAGYAWRYQDEPMEYVAVEQQFELPLLNPDTGRASKT